MKGLRSAFEKAIQNANDTGESCQIEDWEQAQKEWEKCRALLFSQLQQATNELLPQLALSDEKKKELQRFVETIASFSLPALATIARLQQLCDAINGISTCLAYGYAAADLNDDSGGPQKKDRVAQEITRYLGEVLRPSAVDDDCPVKNAFYGHLLERLGFEEAGEKKGGIMGYRRTGRGEYYYYKRGDNGIVVLPNE